MLIILEPSRPGTLDGDKEQGSTVMGIGDSIEQAAENAMEDLGGVSEATDDGHAPEPGAPDEEIKVHSSISEGSNALEDTDETPGRSSGPPQSPHLDENTGPGGGRAGRPDAAADAEVRGVPRDVPGPGGLPGPDPDALRADPSESDEDPSADMGRG
jgi:hypothetical protein